MGGARGQISMEYLLVTAFAFLILVPIILIAYSQQSRFSQDVTAAQLQKIGSTLVDNANAVYYAGQPTKRTVQLYFPEGIQGITISGNAITFDMMGTPHYQYAAFAETNMTGSLRTFTGLHTIEIVAGENEVNVTEA